MIAFTYKMGEDEETIELVQAPGALVRVGEEWQGYASRASKGKK